MLRVPRVVGVQLAYLAFIAAEFGAWVAVLVYAYEATGPLSVGVVAVAQLIPAALLAPVVATIGEHFARDRALAVGYAVASLATAAVGVAMLAEVPPLLVYALAVVQLTSLTTIRPIQAAILPALVGTAEQLTAANAVSMVAEGLGMMLGPLAVGLVLTVAGPGAAFLAAAGVTLVGAALVGGVSATSLAPRPAASAAPASSAGAGGEPHESPRRRDLLAGVRLIAGHPSGLAVAILIGIRQVAIGALDVLLVIAAIELLRMGDEGAGFLNAALGLGTVVGGAATLGLAGRSRLSPYVLLGAVIWAVFLGATVLLRTPEIAVLLLALAAIGLTVLEATARTLLQRLLPLGAMASAFGVMEAFMLGGLALGALVAGPLVQLGGLLFALGALGALIPAVALLVLPVIAGAERHVYVPLREIALLRRLPLFAPVPAPALEAAARASVTLRAEPGETIIREGDVGDRFYVVVSGEVSVSREAAELRRLGPGAGFGEIALLRAVPRTASVRAVEPAELLALGRTDFLLAITGTVEALDEANRVAEGYLEADRRAATTRGG